MGKNSACIPYLVVAGYETDEGQVAPGVNQYGGSLRRAVCISAPSRTAQRQKHK